MKGAATGQVTYVVLGYNHEVDSLIRNPIQLHYRQVRASRPWRSPTIRPSTWHMS